MPPKSMNSRMVIGKRWVHWFEEDTPDGSIYRPETEELPLSRRPRERLELDTDGSARILLSGPDDRLVATPATWREEQGSIVLRAAGGPGSRMLELRIVQAAPDRLLVHRQP